MWGVSFYDFQENKVYVDLSQDEVVAVKDFDAPKGRIVIRAEDFSSWLVDDLTWNWGLTACFYDKPTIKLMSSSNGIPVTSLLSNSKLDFSEIEKEKETGSLKLFYFTIQSLIKHQREILKLKVEFTANVSMIFALLSEISISH